MVFDVVVASVSITLSWIAEEQNGREYPNNVQSDEIAKICFSPSVDGFVTVRKFEVNKLVLKMAALLTISLRSVTLTKTLVEVIEPSPN